MKSANRSFNFEKQLKSKLAKWYKNPTTFEAIELVNSGFIANLTELVLEPAQYLLKKKNVLSEPIIDLCNRIVEKNLTYTIEDPIVNKLDDLNFLIQKRISSIREPIHRNSRNAI